jgi:hypothetical protein
MIALTRWSWGLYCVDIQETDTEVDMGRKHARGRYVRNDPRGGQWRFWVLLALAALVAVGWLVIQHADRLH